MILRRIRVRDFGCFRDFDLTDLDRIAIIIGENDAGKTVLLNAIETLVSRSGYDHERHPRKDVEGDYAEEIFIEGWFTLEPHDDLPARFRSGPLGDELYVKRTFGMKAETCVVKGQGYEDDRFDDFEGLLAPEQKDLLKKYGLSPESRQENRVEQVDELVEDGKLHLVEKDLEISFSSLASHLARVERISATDYQSPDSLIRSTLRRVARSVIEQKDSETGDVSEHPSLQQVRAGIVDRVEGEVLKAEDALRKEHPRLRRLGVTPEVDFAGATMNFNLMIDLGDGDRLLRSFGDGTKKRMWMGLLEWQREADKSSATHSVIRLYDEPDVNLHYEAQRTLFDNISEIAEDAELRTQCFVCTHSVFLIDRAPARYINLIKPCDDGSRDALRIEDPDDDGHIEFFNQIGQAVGLTNTALLYEKGFLVVEGESEETSVPHLYEVLYDRKLVRDGIRMINLKTCGAWPSVLGALLKNRLDYIHLLLDSDCREPESTANVTPERIKEVGCPEGFVETQVTFIGEKEYEDAFADRVILAGLNADFPRADGLEWEQRHLEEVRETGDKFSEDLAHAVLQAIAPQQRQKARKPYIAASIARGCDCPADVPEQLREALDALRHRAGI